MRNDMKKVVTEKPRSGGRIKQPKGYNRYNRIDEDSPKGEKIRRKWQDGWTGKEFTDVLGPIVGFLRKNVGRPWNKVYSEISKQLPKTSVQNQHIYTHIFQFVERNVIIIDGVACYADCKFYRGQIPITSDSRYPQFYVNPVTGLLCLAKVKQAKSKQEIKRVDAYPGLVYLRLEDGIWYGVKVKKLSDNVVIGSLFASYHDTVLNRYFRDEKELINFYGTKVIAIEKYRLTKQEIRRNNLTR